MDLFNNIISLSINFISDAEVETLEPISSLPEKEVAYLKTAIQAGWIILTINMVAILIMFYFACRAISLTKCKDFRITLLLIFMNLTLLSTMNLVYFLVAQRQ